MQLRRNDTNVSLLVLYNEDFSVPTNVEANNDKDISLQVEEVKSDLFSKEDLEEAYQKGICQGRNIEKELYISAKVKEDHEYKKEILKIFDSISVKTIDMKDNISRGFLSFLLGALVNLFPSMLEEYGAEETRRTLQKIRQFIDCNPLVELTCSKDFFERIDRNLSDFSKGEINVRIDETMKGDDFKISWNSGGFVRNANEYIDKITSEILSVSGRK